MGSRVYLVSFDPINAIFENVNILLGASYEELVVVIDFYSVIY